MHLRYNGQRQLLECSARRGAIAIVLAVRSQDAAARRTRELPTLTTGRKRRRPEIRPRVVNDAETAVYLGKSISWFAQNRLRLEQQHGFPRRLDVIGGTDLEAVDTWLDKLQQQPALGADDPEIQKLLQKAMADVRL
jgi:hypothetical protein